MRRMIVKHDMRRVVVTGMGMISSIGFDVAQNLKSLQQGTSGISFSDVQKKYNFRSHVHGDPHRLYDDLNIEKRSQRFMNTGAKWNYIAMQEAISDSGLEEKEISHPMTGILMGSGGIDSVSIRRVIDITLESGPKKVGPFSVPQMMTSSHVACLAVLFKILGVNYSVSSACATSTHCIGHGVELIQWGKQDIMFVGGGDALDWSSAATFDAMKALSSKHNHTPEQASRPYDKDRDGFVMSAGAGVLVLEELEHAKKRGADIYAEMIGYAATSDGFDMVQPSGKGAARCMKMALKETNIPVNYISPHATSTPLGDLREIEAIQNVFGHDIPPLSATKSLTGHALGATGVHEAIYSLLMMKHNFITASANIETLSPEFFDIPIVRELRENVKMDCVLSNSFGFGGTNATLVFKKI